MLVVGIILVLVGGGLFYGHIKTKEKIYELRTVEKFDIGTLVEIQQEISAEIGGGSYQQEAEIVGTIECEAPLTSPLGEQPCVYYSMTIEHEFEKQEWDKNEGEHRWRKASESIQTDTQGTPFNVRDETGTIEVDPAGAKFDPLVSTVDKFEPAQGGGQMQLQYGGFSMTVGGGMQQDRRTLGYRYKESIMPAGKKVTVIGEVVDPMGTAVMRKSYAKGLTISTRSREEIVEATKATARNLKIAAIVVGAIGVVLAIIGAVS